MKKAIMVFMMFFLVLVAAGHPRAEEATDNQKPQTVCPVMGGAINKEIFADYQGKRVYFCCKSCMPVFEESPERFIEQLESTGIILEKVPAPDSQQKPADTHEHKSSSGCGCDCCS